MQQDQTQLENQDSLEQPRVLTAKEIAAVAGGPYMEPDL